MSELTKYLSQLKKQFLVQRKQDGGRRKRFREYVGRQFGKEPEYFTKLALDAYMEAANLIWERQPRKHGNDLFSVSGYTIPEYLTRPSRGYIPADDADDAEIEDEGFEKVDFRYATVQDLRDDATIKLRKAAQSAAAAEEEMKAADEAERRARFDMAALLRDVCDGAASAAA